MSGQASPEIARAAALLEAAASHPDGWLPAGGSDQQLWPTDPCAVEAWAKKLLTLISERPSIEILDAESDQYPTNLRSVEGRPALLFADGELREEDERAVAIVGSRHAHNGALEMTEQIAQALAAHGHTIVSGLARGIDSAAHRGAIKAGGRTLGVMGTGIELVYPPENDALADAIRTHGALISQFPPDQAATKTTFPARNAVIAGLSKGSLVITANKRSGTRIEIDYSLAQRRPVLFWEPLLGLQQWAQELANDPLVRFVQSVDDIEEALGELAA